MPNLTIEEWELLGQLSTGEKMITGGAPRSGMARLIELGLASDRAVNMSDVVYTITAQGRAALAQRQAAASP